MGAVDVYTEEEGAGCDLSRMEPNEKGVENGKPQQVHGQGAHPGRLVIASGHVEAEKSQETLQKEEWPCVEEVPVERADDLSFEGN